MTEDGFCMDMEGICSSFYDLVLWPMMVVSRQPPVSGSGRVGSIIVGGETEDWLYEIFADGTGWIMKHA